MEMTNMSSSYRKGWFIVAGAVVVVIAFFLLIYTFNVTGKHVGWDMGGKEFVPASSHYATDYYAPADPDYAVTKKD